MPIDFHAAKVIANAEIDSISKYNNDKCIISDIKHLPSLGWLFLYDTEVFLTQHITSHALAGNVPLLVSYEGKLSYVKLDDVDSLLKLSD